jgi:para-nitrobenzyl esterase
MRCLLFFLAASCSFGQSQPAVSIDSGSISGIDTADVRAWLGIPYAAPPVGDLRWRAPQPAAHWQGVRAADKVGPACIQAMLGGRAAGNAPQSEDCLTVNVWAPKEARQLAVMVWIHGGAFVQGTGGSPYYSGASLAHKGVVVVTLNYRLGDLGFFAHPELSSESPGQPAGNFGLLDQIAALRWVRKNIAAFGGDPRKVTLFGESAGAMSIYLLMTSPEARPLFARAIAESGPILGPTRSLAQLQRSSEDRARAWGAADLPALRALPAQTFAHSALPAGPVVDGKLVPEEPRTAFAEGRQAAVPLLIGANSFEASLMVLLGISENAVLSAASGVGAETLHQFYGDDRRRQAQQLFTDTGFLEPTRYLAARMEKLSQPAYLYYFSYVAERNRARAPGVAHGGEILYVFDNPPAAALASLVTEADSKMADTVSTYWVNFAKTGNPNGAGLPEWPAYRATTDRLLELGPEIAVREHFRKPQLDRIEQVRASNEAGKAK